MHPFYKRMDIILAAQGTNRHSFCKQYGYKPNTLQNYWGTNKLPPGNIVADLCAYVEESADYLLYGKKKQVKFTPEMEAIIEMLEMLSEENRLMIKKLLRFLIKDQLDSGKNSENPNL